MSFAFHGEGAAEGREGPRRCEGLDATLDTPRALRIGSRRLVGCRNGLGMVGNG